MNDQYFSGVSIFNGTVRYVDLAYILGTEDDLVRQEVPHTWIYELDQGNWGAEDIGWAAVSCSICHVPSERLIVISPMGRVLAWGGGGSLEEPPVSVGNVGPNTRGPLREVRGIAGGHAYACGTNRQLYKRSAPGVWTRLDHAAEPSEDDFGTFCFESVDGFSEKDIYTVGWEGEIWHFDGTRLSQIASPTNLALHAVRCAGNGRVYAAGQVGSILEGHGDDWIPIAHDQTEDHFRSIEWFEDRPFFSTGRNVYELVDGQLRPVVWGADTPRTCLRLSARDGRMWSIGAKDVMELRGSKWTRVLTIK